jgi:hypothetical protein
LLPATVPPSTIYRRLRSEKAYCGAGGRGFDSRHLHDEYRPLTRDFSLIGGLFRAKRHKKNTRGSVLGRVWPPEFDPSLRPLTIRQGSQVGQGEAGGIARTRSVSGVPERPLTNRSVLDITMQ